MDCQYLDNGEICGLRNSEVSDNNPCRGDYETCIFYQLHQKGRDGARRESDRWKGVNDSFAEFVKNRY